MSRFVDGVPVRLLGSPHPLEPADLVEQVLDGKVLAAVPCTSAGTVPGARMLLGVNWWCGPWAEGQGNAGTALAFSENLYLVRLPFGAEAQRTVGCGEVCGVRVCVIPANEPLPLLESGEVDVGRVTEIEIVFVGDYHRG